VQVIKFGRQTSIEKIHLDANNRGQLTLQNFGTDISRALLVISGLTPVTTESASFTVSIASQ